MVPFPLKSFFCRSSMLLLMMTINLGGAVVHQTPLPYPTNALEPFISRESLEWHYRLHSVYVERTNELIAGTILDKMPLPVIVMTAPYKSELYNFSLQAMNHNVQWPLLAPPPIGGGEPKGALGAAIHRKFGGLEGLKKEFLEESWKVFASGYVALVKRDCDKELEVVVTGDADNPLRLGLGVPIFVLDLWEHAYYLDVRITRQKYILDSFNIVNWDQCNKLYEGDLTLLLS